MQLYEFNSKLSKYLYYVYKAIMMIEFSAVTMH